MKCESNTNLIKEENDMLFNKKSLKILMVACVLMYSSVAFSATEDYIADPCDTIDGWVRTNQDDNYNPVAVEEAVDNGETIVVESSSHTEDGKTGWKTRYLRKEWTFDADMNADGMKLQFDAVFEKTGGNYYNSPFLIINLFDADGVRIGCRVIFSEDTIGGWHRGYVANMASIYPGKYIIVPDSGSFEYDVAELMGVSEFRSLEIVLGNRVGYQEGTNTLSIDNIMMYREVTERDVEDAEVELENYELQNDGSILFHEMESMELFRLDGPHCYNGPVYAVEADGTETLITKQVNNSKHGREVITGSYILKFEVTHGKNAWTLLSTDSSVCNTYDTDYGMIFEFHTDDFTIVLLLTPEYLVPAVKVSCGQ